MTTTVDSGVGRFGGLRRWWGVRSTLEQVSIVLGGGVLALLILWLGIWQPLQRDNERMTRQLAVQRASVIAAKVQVDAMAGLEHSAAADGSREPRVDLDATLASLGIKATTVERTEDGRLRVSFDSIAFDALTRLLDQLQRNGHLRAVDVTATGRVEPGQVRAEFTLTR